MKCVACGSGSLVGGVVASGSGTDDLMFRPGHTSFLKTMFGIGSRPIRAYGCARCGHLQLGVKFTEDDLQRFLEFDGQQPGVLERLGGEPESGG